MKPPEHVETERMILRKPKPEDADAMFTGWAQASEVTRYLVWRPHKNIEESHIIIERCLQLWDSESDYPYVLTLKGLDTPTGMLALHPEKFKVAVGYVLAKDYWGKGYMTEAVREIMNWLLEQPDVFRVFAICDVENLASARVMEPVDLGALLARPGHAVLVALRSFFVRVASSCTFSAPSSSASVCTSSALIASAETGTL